MGAYNSSDERLKKRPPGFWPADKGADKWRQRNGIGKKEGRRRFHDIKKDDNMSGAADDYSVDPDTGEVLDPTGEDVGNLNDG